MQPFENAESYYTDYRDWKNEEIRTCFQQAYLHILRKLEHEPINENRATYKIHLVVYLQMKDSMLVPINDEKVVMTAYWKLTLSFYYCPNLRYDFSDCL